MAATFLGEFPVRVEDTEYREFKPADWAMLWIEKYGQIEGAHHRAWTLDQVARILKGTQVIVKEARWAGFSKPEVRFVLDEPSTTYLEWVKAMEGDGEFDYEAGVAP